MQRQALLGLVLELLRSSGKPLHARAIVAELESAAPGAVTGRTPWKTVGARLATDIRDNPSTPFMRIGSGLYALREWDDLRPVSVPRRRVAPLEEEILVVPRARFMEIVAPRPDQQLHRIRYEPLLDSSVPCRRIQAEQTEELVQLIPSFIILKGNQVLSFRRTRKSPEERLRDRHSIVFGGHLQSEDDTGLINSIVGDRKLSLIRELYEELSFSTEPEKIEYFSLIYLQGSMFERQHCGILFLVDLDSSCSVSSNEPGYASTLNFLGWPFDPDHPVHSDRWSAAVIASIKAGAA